MNVRREKKGGEKMKKKTKKKIKSWLSTVGYLLAGLGTFLTGLAAIIKALNLK